jgi:hypothetical protein
MKVITFLANFAIMVIIGLFMFLIGSMYGGMMDIFLK